MVYNNAMSENTRPEQRKPGRPKGTGTGRTKVKVHVSMDPHLVDWAMTQPGGFSATVRRCLEGMQRRAAESQPAD